MKLGPVGSPAAALRGLCAGTSGVNSAEPCTRVAISTRLMIRGNELTAVLLWHHGVRWRTPTDGLPSQNLAHVPVSRPRCELGDVSLIHPYRHLPGMSNWFERQLATKRADVPPAAGSPARRAAFPGTIRPNQ